MNVNRYAVLDRDFPVLVDAEQHRLCRWCHRPVEPPRRNWCGSSQCLYEVQIRTSPSFAREEVFKRDRGICALCGLDCREVEEQANNILHGPRPTTYVESRAAFNALWQNVFGINAPRGYGFRGPHAWEADHIVPVVEGGGVTGLENLRTLCLRCHRAETAALAARRAAARRPPALPSPQLLLNVSR